MSYGDTRVISNISDLLVDVTGDLPGCPDVLIRRKLAEVAVRFCRDTGALRSMVGPFSIEADVASYIIECPINATVRDVHRVFICDVEQHPASYSFVANVDGDVLLTLGSIPSADVEDAIEVDVSMMPRPGCETYPSGFMQDWRHAIIAGTLAELLSDEKMRCFNPSKAARNEREYSVAKQDACYRRLTGLRQDGRLDFASNDSFAGSFG